MLFYLDGALYRRSECPPGLSYCYQGDSSHSIDAKVDIRTPTLIPVYSAILGSLVAQELLLMYLLERTPLPITSKLCNIFPLITLQHVLSLQCFL